MFLCHLGHVNYNIHKNYVLFFSNRSMSGQEGTQTLERELAEVTSQVALPLAPTPIQPQDPPDAGVESTRPQQPEPQPATPPKSPPEAVQRRVTSAGGGVVSSPPGSREDSGNSDLKVFNESFVSYCQAHVPSAVSLKEHLATLKERLHVKWKSRVKTAEDEKTLEE